MSAAIGELAKQHREDRELLVRCHTASLALMTTIVQLGVDNGLPAPPMNPAVEQVVSDLRKRLAKDV